MPIAPLAHDEVAIRALRGWAIDAVQKANSGHPGLPLGAAPLAYTLWNRHLRFDPHNPKWFNRDRFVLSAGHGSMLIYGLLHLFGYRLSMDELMNFRQWGSKTPGHPENFLTPGVEMATGPLGQGISTAVGMALAERWVRAKTGGEASPVDHFTYVIASDGDLMEGVANEAASFAGHQKLGKLIVLYDDNEITIDGRTDLAFTEDIGAKFAAMGWHVQKVDGMSTDAVDKAIEAAKAATDQPSLIQCRTIIGFGSPNKADSSKVHGSPLGEEELIKTKEKLGIPQVDFWVPDAVKKIQDAAIEQGKALSADWNSQAAGHSGLQELLNREPRDVSWPSFDSSIATRNASQDCLNALADSDPRWFGGSADLAGSVMTGIRNAEDLNPGTPEGRNVHFGVREHAMAAIVNGVTLHGAGRAYGGTFLIFSDYCKPSLRLAALMETPSVFLFSHDSIGLGEDGPTHQPIEHLAGLRAIPNFDVLRPADGNETAACWQIAAESEETPCALILTRQKVPAISPPMQGTDHPAKRGAYVVKDVEVPQVVLVGTGSEVSIAMAAADALKQENISARVVSMPSWKRFDAQDREYRDSVFTPGIPVVSVEAASSVGWAKYSDIHIGLDRFGASAPAETLYEKLGITAEAVVSAAKSLI